jgi:Zn-dependent oligopeptidase
MEWNLSVQEIDCSIDLIIKNINKTYRNVLSIPKNKQTFENTLRVISNVFSISMSALNRITFLQYVHPDDDIRGASKTADLKLDHFFIELEMRRDIFELIKYISLSGDKLQPEDKRYIEHLLRNYKRSGMYIEDEDTRTSLKEMQKELTKLGSDFSANIVNDNTTASFTKEELDGLSEQFFKDLQLDESGTKYIVPMKYPYTIPIMKYANNEETRKKLDFINKSRCSDNVDLLYKMTTIRNSYTKMLGYKSFSEYILEIRMAKNTKTVDDFLASLFKKLRILRGKEISVMESMKKSKIYTWDRLYYDQKLKKEKYGIDDDVIKQYFSVDHVLEVVFKQYQSLFEIKIVQVSEEESSNLWHPEVIEYKVYSLNTNKLLGTFATDLFARPNKFEHYACFPIVNRINDLDGGVITPAYCVLVGNFTASGVDTPSLLLHSDVETLYHEFGHVIHNILGGASHSLFSGTHVEWDFVEMPSQMLENLCWEFQNIKKLSKHWETNEELSDGQITMLLSTRHVNSGLIYCKQVLFAMIDQLMHGEALLKSPSDLNETYSNLSKEIFGFEEQENTSDLALFGHLATGYAASYYGYLWSKVYADDIYSVLSDSSEKWPEYCAKILSRGGTKSAQDLLLDFLGREPHDESFLENLGI